MIETIIEVLIVAGTLAYAGLTMRGDAARSGRVCSIAFILLVAACIAFSIVQGAAAAGFLAVALAFSPLEVLSLIAIVYWLSYVIARGKMFDKMIGE